MKKPSLHSLLTLAAGTAFAVIAVPAYALNILLVNDDGLTANVRAQYEALVAAGHDVIVSVPCQNQSGKGASISFLAPLTPLATACRNNAAAAGAPGAGPMPDKANYYYVNGTPVMATIYGLDVLAPQRWGKAPDLVISGPNEGQNAGPIVNSSGTVSNAQYAAAQGLSAIAVSADANTTNNDELAAEAAPLILTLIETLQRKAEHGRLLPPGVALNVNYPKFAAGESAKLRWRFTREGTYSVVNLKFVPDLSQDPLAQSAGLGNQPYPGITFNHNATTPTPQQRDDSAAVVAAGGIAVSVMQVGFDAAQPVRQSMQRRLRGLVVQCVPKAANCR